MKTERRRFRRIRAPVFYRIPKRSVPRQRAKDLSLGGVQIYCDDRLEVDQTLELEFFLPNGLTIEAAARVVWIRQQRPGSGGVYDVGMEFLRLSEGARRELDDVLERVNPPIPV